MSGVDPNAIFNLSKARALLIDKSQHSLDVLWQILKGLGLSNMTRSDSVDDADKQLRLNAYDIIIIDPALEGGAGYELISRLRHSAGKNAHVPVVLTTGHVRAADVAKGRDTGANFVVIKPITPNVLLQRILWIGRDKRPFVEAGNYVGPDRRFKFDGPPQGSDGRRQSDLTQPLGEASEPNMSQDEINAMIKPQRVSL